MIHTRSDGRSANAWGRPPRQGWSLALRLGLLATLVVIGVMAAITGLQLKSELEAELRARQTQLGRSMAPLIAALQGVVTRQQAVDAIKQFHASYVDQGQAPHRLAIVNQAGRVVIESFNTDEPGSGEWLTAEVSLVSPAFGSETIDLVVAEDDSVSSAAGARRWRMWGVHVGITALLILVSLFIVIRREVTGPIDRLLGGVRKMELGYWNEMPDPGGAWEIRWLAWRFHTLGLELTRSVEQLVAAQRRAFAADRAGTVDSDATNTEAPPEPAVPVQGEVEPAIVLLQEQLERLRCATPGDISIRSMAQLAWDRHAVLAERLGELELSRELEDTALHVLDPDGFRDIFGRIEAERPRLELLARARSEKIRRAVAARYVPVVEICHRIKHPAGIWRKMQQKNLSFDQVHDLIALRLVVPTEMDCYQALGVVHDLYVPIVGRFKDYVVRPKSNGYRSLHSSVRDSQGDVFEVQIRSVAMHRHAERGLAAHADYRETARVPATSGYGAVWRRLLRTNWWQMPTK